MLSANGSLQTSQKDLYNAADNVLLIVGYRPPEKLATTLHQQDFWLTRVEHKPMSGIQNHKNDRFVGRVPLLNATP